MGCAGATWGGGGRGTKAEAIINPDATVEIRCGTQDLGTGSKTVIALIAALFGFGGIAAGAAGIAKLLFFIFIVLAVASLIVNALRGRGPPL